MPRHPSVLITKIPLLLLLLLFCPVKPLKNPLSPLLNTISYCPTGPFSPRPLHREINRKFLFKDKHCKALFDCRFKRYCCRKDTAKIELNWEIYSNYSEGLILSGWRGLLNVLRRAASDAVCRRTQGSAGTGNVLAMMVLCVNRRQSGRLLSFGGSSRRRRNASRWETAPHHP